MVSILFVGILSAWLMPLHFPPWISWHNELLVFSAVIVASGQLLWKRRAEAFAPHTPDLPYATWPLAFLLCVVAAQSGTGVIAMAGSGLTLAMYLLLCIISLWIGFQASTPQGGVHHQAGGTGCVVEHLAWMTLLGGALSSIFAMVQGLDVWESVDWIMRMPTLRRPGANMGQPNHLATLVLMSLVSVVFLYLKQRLSGLLTWVLAMVLLQGLAISESRTGGISLMLVTAWWLFTTGRATLKKSVVAAVSAITFYAIGLVFWPICIEIVSEGGLFEQVLPHINTTPNMRLQLWQQLAESVTLRPWFGWGLGEVAKAHNVVLHGYSESMPLTYAHNIFLDIAVGAGLPVAIVLVGAYVIWWIRRARNAGDTVSWYCLAMTIPFTAHSLLEFPFAYAYFLAPVMFAIGVLEARQAPSVGLRAPLWLMSTIWTLFAAASIGSTIEYIRIEEDFRVARFEYLRIGKTPSDYERPNLYLLTQLRTMLYASRTDPQPNMSQADLDMLKDAAEHYPWSAIQNRYALALALNGNPTEAVRQLMVMRAMHGEDAYESIRTNWEKLAQARHPQLNAIKVP